jgi:DNA gyrase subunit A
MSEEITNTTAAFPESFAFLTKGYLEYAEEVIRERAIIGIDGLTPSQRRILVAMHDIEHVKNNTKCASVVGATMKLHPHGDASIYQTLCKLTDVSERMNVPLIKGKGRFQKIYSNEPSAASCY